jgi:hypothetical protein
LAGGAFYPCTPSNTSVQEFQGGETISMRCSAPQGPAGVCPSAADVCIYPNVPGFSVCFQGVGDLQCPDYLPKKHLVFEKSQACECGCGDASGDSCSTTVTVYEDSACSKPVGSVTATSEQPTACGDFSPGSALGSKSASLTYTAGTCAPTLDKTTVNTACCLP